MEDRADAPSDLRLPGVRSGELLGSVTGATHGLLRNRQTVVLAQAVEARHAAPPQGRLRTVLLGLVRLDAVRLPSLRTGAPGPLVDGGNSVKINQLVTYAGGLYCVVGVNGDLLTLDGVADARRNCRPRCTVLASDVTVVYARQCPEDSILGQEARKATQNTGGASDAS
jgi:hypothetical protein